jgi:hypothetical protein
MAELASVRRELIRRLEGLTEQELQQLLDLATSFARPRPTPPVNGKDDNPLDRLDGVFDFEPLSAEQIEEELYGKDAV